MRRRRRYRRKKNRKFFQILIVVAVIFCLGIVMWVSWHVKLEERSNISERNSFIAVLGEKGDEGKENDEEKEGSEEKAKDIVAFYQEIYEEILETNSSDGLERMQKLVARLGELGIVAVDEKNQVDMTRIEDVLKFCDSVNRKEKAELTILVVSDSGGLTKYGLKTENGNVDIVKDTYQYENKELRNIDTVSFRASSFTYSEEGYLLFGGNRHSEDYYVLELADLQECAALRVQPLEETCRELNRKYILPVGYEKNNLFLTDWSEKELGNLNFYDIFDRFYPMAYGKPLPYTADENLNIRAVYQIPKEEFEAVIQEYFRIDSRVLQSKTTYFSEDKTYEYKPRGFYESEYPDIPYPEVVDYRENTDGTITLTVNAVYPEECTSKAYTHEVVIRPLTEGRFQYVSNHMLSSGEGYENWWHAERLTEEEWEELYSNMNRPGVGNGIVNNQGNHAG